MKRVTVLLLVLLLIPGLIAVPASASTQGVIDAIWDTHDELGEWLGTCLGDLRDLLQDTVDRLDWLDDSVRLVETQLLNILDEIYTKGTLTIGECVKGIRSYIVTIAGYLDTGVEYTIGQFMNRFDDAFLVIEGKLYEIVSFMENHLGVNRKESDAIIDDAEQTTDDLEDMENLLATSPTIDDSGVDSAISGVNGKFQNITNDADGTLLFGALGEIAKGNIFGQIIPTTAMLGVLSFALFGRVF